MNKFKVLLVTFSLLLSFNRVFGQSYNAGVGFAKPSEFVFQTYKNQKLISIRLLGAVNKAGVYHVPKDLKLVTLLSLAGGTTSEADVEDILVGNESEGQSQKIDLYESIKSGSKGAYSLKANDVILVKRKKSLISNDTWKIISVISVLLTGALTAIAINDKI